MKKNKKRVYLKKWVDYLLLSVNCFLVILLASINDFKNILLYLSITIISIIIISINGIILNKYSKILNK